MVSCSCLGDFPMPVIVTEPKSQLALKEGNISLECVAASGMDSPMTIEWKKDHAVSAFT